MKKLIGKISTFILSATLACSLVMPTVMATEIGIIEEDMVSANTVTQTAEVDEYELTCQNNKAEFYKLIKASVFANEDGTPTAEACVNHENIKYAQDHAQYVAKANEICTGLTDDAAKAEAMYKWIATNMFHDYFYQERKDIYSPLAGYMPNGTTSAWNRGGGVCFDMSAIYMIMCHSQNIPAVIACNTTHAWNVIYVNENWYLVDCDNDCRNKAYTEDLSDLITRAMWSDNFELYDTVGIYGWINHKPTGFYNLNSTPEEIAEAIKLAREVRGLDNPGDNSTGGDNSNITDDEDDVIPPAGGSSDVIPPSGGSDVIPPSVPTTPSDSGASKPAVKKLKSQKITCKVTKKTYKKSSLKKKSKSFYIKAKAKTKVSYKVSKYPKGGKKYIKVSSKGKVTIKKGAKKGTYKITVTAKKTSKYKKATKTVTIKVK